MRLTVDPDNMLQKSHASGSPPVFDESQVEQTPYGIRFSAESQIQLKYLREYVGQCRSVLDEINTDLSRLIEDPEDRGHISETVARLCRFCMEANSRGQVSLYQVAFELQKTLLHAGGCGGRAGFWEAIHRSLFILAALVEQCEIDFRRRLAVQDAIEGLRQISV